MSKPFAKLFDTEHGQILVKIDAGEDSAPEVRFFAEPPGLGVCSVALAFEDSDEGWDTAEQAFEKVDIEMAIRATAQLRKFAGELGGTEA